jgi:Transposase IS66 family
MGGRKSAETPDIDEVRTASRTGGKRGGEPASLTSCGQRPSRWPVGMGVNQTATTLHLDGGKLKRRMMATGRVLDKTMPPAFSLGAQRTVMENCARGRMPSSRREVEPNSGLGQAISYPQRHPEKLTLFLRVAGAPIDNNIERALKKAILHRRNSLFYKTRNRPRMGDLFMSLIHTCELNGANPFDYLTELQRHTEELKQKPSECMPWNYRETLARLAKPTAA